MLLQINSYSAEPVYDQISRQLADKIISGDLDGGESLHSVRKLASGQRVNVRTVERAYNRLLKEGLITWKNGRDFCVAKLSDQEKAAIRKENVQRRLPHLSVVDDFSRELISILDVEKLCRLYETTACKYFYVGAISFILFDDSTQCYHSSTSDGNAVTLSNLDPLITFCKNNKSPFPTSSLLIDSSEGASSKLSPKCDVVLPLHDADSLLGFIAIENSDDGRSLSDADIDALDILAHQFATALITVKFYIEAIQHRSMRAELSSARHLQNSLLPPPFMQDENVTIAARTLASHVVSGDMYDYFKIDDSRYGFIIADACGHGAAAALLIAQIQTIFKFEKKRSVDISERMRGLNDYIRSSATANKFVTLFFGIYDCTNGQLEYINAGHNFPFVLHPTGEHTFLTTSSPALGILQDAEFAKGSQRLYKDDLIVFYTDGISETMDVEMNEFGEERLLRSALKSRQEPDLMIEAIIKDAETFSDKATQEDDQTLMAVKINNQKNNQGREE
jgi:phosphoserine phosphatase RsbU/P